MSESGKNTAGVEGIIHWIRELAEDGEPPSQIEYNTHPDTPSLGNVHTYFDDWSAAVEEAGFSYEPHEVDKPNIPDPEVGEV